MEHAQKGPTTDRETHLVVVLTIRGKTGCGTYYGETIPTFSHMDKERGILSTINTSGSSILWPSRHSALFNHCRHCEMERFWYIVFPSLEDPWLFVTLDWVCSWWCHIHWALAFDNGPQSGRGFI